MQLQETARGLEDSYRKLQSQADLIIRIEQQLRRVERFSALGEMSAALAHEIRNPLGSIRGTAEILRDDFRPSDGKYEFLEILIKETDRLNRVVEDFLRLAKPVEPDRELFRIDSDLREIVALLHPEARARGVVLALDAPEPVELSGDREKLKQVFLNLLLNALQATDRGGEITVVVGCSNGNGEFRHAQVTVLDNGSGIDPALLPRIFEPFFTTKQGGTGLGLAIAQRIIESHGGTITVESRAGQGSSFTVTLPLVP
jgi:signal transduction histidine kinase